MQGWIQPDPGGGAGHLDQIHEDLCNNAVTIFESIGRQKWDEICIGM
jgi:hypothetical protein